MSHDQIELSENNEQRETQVTYVGLGDPYPMLTCGSFCFCIFASIVLIIASVFLARFINQKSNILSYDNIPCDITYVSTQTNCTSGCTQMRYCDSNGNNCFIYSSIEPLETKQCLRIDGEIKWKNCVYTLQYFVPVTTNAEKFIADNTKEIQCIFSDRNDDCVNPFDTLEIDQRINPDIEDLNEYINFTRSIVIIFGTSFFGSCISFIVLYLRFIIKRYIEINSKKIENINA